MDDRTQMMIEVKSFRLMLSDTMVEGGQRVKTFSLARGEVDVMSMQSLVDKLREHLGFGEVVKERLGEYAKEHKVSQDNLGKVAWLLSTGGFSIVGIDGSRHAPIRSDGQLVSFFKTIRNSRLPSVQVKLAPPVAVHAAPAQQQGVAPSVPTPKHRRQEKDRVEELEDLNFKLTKATQKVNKAVEDVQRQMVTDKDEIQRRIASAQKEINEKFEAQLKQVALDLKKLSEADEATNSDVGDVRQQLQATDKRAVERHKEALRQMEDIKVDMADRFEEVHAEIQSLREEDERLTQEDHSQNQQLAAHEKELQRLDSVKVQKVDWQAAEDAMSRRIDDELADVRRKLAATEKELKESIHQQRKELDAADKALGVKLQTTTDRIDGELKRLDQELTDSVTKLNTLIVNTRAELEAQLSTEITKLSSSCDQRFHTLDVFTKASDKELRQSLKDVDSKAEATFTKVFERLENLVKAERSRLGNIERDLQNLSTKLRSDCRAEVERVRVDYEQEAARLDGDLSDLHMKHDVVKQEINFFQSRLLEQRDWAQRQLAETATATRAAQVDAQEGVAAATKMAHALRDDQVAFRDKMAKHISLLQHASDSYGDAINTLETQRVRMRLELDAVLDDHKAYVNDMDGWADDVRVKVERLFRAMEPPRCEWRISRAKERMKDMKKPLLLSSPNFALQGLRDVQMQFYPSGTNQSLENKAVLRLILPPNAQVRYQCWLGKMSEGSREYKGGGSLYVDLMFDGWRDQVLEDGSLKVSLEVLEDLTNTDASLARLVHLEYENPK
jgi:chromosome segregation ATPase